MTLNIAAVTTLLNGREASYEAIEALTRKELQHLLEDAGMDAKEVRGMVRAKMANAIWAAVKPVEQAKPEAPIAETVATEPKAKKDKSKACACGCGLRTKGGTWMPGHDAKHAAALRGGAKHQARACGCGCGEMTKGGMFRPGHDAKYYSALHASAKIGVEPKFLPKSINPAEFQLIDVFAEVAAAA